MKYDLLNVVQKRKVTLAGTNIYRIPTIHPDRTLQENDLLFINEGEWSICQDDESYRLMAGDMMLLRAYNHHYSLHHCLPNTQTLFVHFSPMPGDQYGVELPTQLSSDVVSGDRLQIATVTHCAEHSQPRTVMRDIIETYWSERQDKQRRMSMLLEVLLNELAHITYEAQMHKENWISNIIRLMYTNHSHMYSLSELAQQAGMSVRTLSERFRRATG